MANKKQSWSKLADSFGMDPEHDVSNQERDQFIETSRREEIAKAAKAKSLDNFLNPGLTTKILARLGFKGAVEKVQLYHEAKSERVEQQKIIREAAKATEQAATSQTREALSNEQSLNSYAESTLGNRKAPEGKAWMAQYLKAGQEAEKKLMANEAEFRAQVAAQGVAMERMVATHKRGEQEITRREAMAEQTERDAQEAAEAYEHSEEAFTERLVSPTEEAEGILRQSMSEGEPNYDPDLESTTETDIRDVFDGAETFFESKAGNKFVDTNPELAASIELAAKKADQLMSEINATFAETDALKALLAGKEVNNKIIGNLGATLNKLTNLERSRAELSRLLDAPDGVIDQLDAIKRPGKEVNKLKEQLANGSARLIKLVELSSYKKDLEKKLPEAIATLASKINASELTEQTLEQKVPYQIQETMKEVEYRLEDSTEVLNQLTDQGEQLLESEERKPIIVMVPIAMKRIRELNQQGREIKNQTEAAKAYMKVLKSNLESGQINNHTVIELSQVVAKIIEIEQAVKNLNQKMNQEHNAADLLTHVKNPGEQTKEYQNTLEQANETSRQTDELNKLQDRMTKQIGQTVSILAKQAGQDKDKLAWTRKMVDWSKEVSEPVETNVYIDEDELDEKLMAEINEQIRNEEITKKFANELGGTESDDQPEIDEAELEAMEQTANQKYDFGDRVFVETFGLKLGGEVKAYTEDGKVEVRFDDGQRQTFNEDQLKVEDPKDQPKAKPIRMLSKEEQQAGVEGRDINDPYQAVGDVGDVPTTIKRRKRVKPTDIDKQLSA